MSHDLAAILADGLCAPDGIDADAVRALLAELLRRGLDPRATRLLTPWEPRDGVHVTCDALRGWEVGFVHGPVQDDLDGSDRYHGRVYDPMAGERWPAEGYDTFEEAQAAVLELLREDGWQQLP